MSKQIPKRSEDYSQWYNEIIKQANLAEISSVRGCMVLKPYGYAIWEKMKNVLDDRFKETGHENAYFPLFIPKSYFSKEASHVEGFAKECAVVTHYRLRNDEQGKIEVDPESRLEEELIVRPTSETIIWDSYRKWIQSYRDLPVLINQWANVVRWEMRTRMFLRTAEILWQEGHTAHASKQEAVEEAEKMLSVYADFVESHMAIPVIKGRKTENEKFAGADTTYTIELLMQDGKALQAGTSHFLGTNFSKAFDVKFANKQGNLEYPWGTSWGVTTRLMGALIMSHSDDKGLVLPPMLAPIQVIIIPIYKDDSQKEEIVNKIKILVDQLKKNKVTVKFDERDHFRPGWKFNEYELKGVPIRLTIGLRDIENNTAELYRRDIQEKINVSLDSLNEVIPKILDDIQKNLFTKALNFRNDNITNVSTYDEFKNILKTKKGFVQAFWDGTTATELKIKEETKATIRCIPLNYNNASEGNCIMTNKPSKLKVIFAEAY